MIETSGVRKKASLRQLFMPNKFWVLPLVFFVIGCATAQSYKKPGIDFSKFNKIAITRFDCSIGTAVGQEVADLVSMEFSKKGYNVIERSQLRALIEEDKLRQFALTESNKNELKLAGINAVIVGSVSRYDCSAIQKILPFMGSFIPLSTQDCNVSLSCKMLNIQTGELIWNATGAHSVNAANMTAHKVLQDVLKLISKEIP